MLSPACWAAQLRADVDPLNNTNFETGNLFGVWVAQGLTDPSHNFPYLLQGGLGMPDRDYYLSTDRAHGRAAQAVPGAHRGDVQAGGLRGPIRPAPLAYSRSKRRWRRCMRRALSRRTCMRAVAWKRGELAAKAPGLDWPALLDAAGLQDAPVFIVWHPKAIPGLSALAATEPLDAWKDWLAFHAIERAAGFLPKAFVDERFSFYGKALSGIPELRPRWQRGMDCTSAALGEAVGQAVRGTLFPGGNQSESAGHGGRPGAGVRQEDRRAHLDVARDQGQSETEAGHAESRRRLSRPVAGLLAASRSSKAMRSGNAAARRTIRIPPSARQTPPAGGPRRVVDDSTDRERGESAACRTR